MNLKLYPELSSSELCLDAADAQTPQQGAEWRVSSGNHGNSPLSLGVISSDAFRLDSATDGSSRHEGSVTEEAEPLDIWAAIKPGHVREKIAIFGSDGRWPNGDRTSSPGVTWDKDGGVAGLCRVRKSKGHWEEKGGAKRQRHVGQEQNVWWDLRTLQPYWTHVDRSPRPAGRAEMVGEGEELKVSVVEMVACLERRFHQQQRDPKPVPAPQKPASFLLGAPPTEPDGVRVSAMVTRLESDRLRTQVEAPGLKRTVGRVLLAAADISSSPCQPWSTSAPPAPQKASEESTSTCLMATPPAGELAASQKAQDPPSQSEEAEPPPGLLFQAPPQMRPVPEVSHSPSPEGGGRARMCAFLEARRRLQQLLEPQPFLTLLPHHLLLRVLAMLPTRSLAALKCASRYFRLVMDTYGVRPADALWVSDPCYSDDPCKQCKKRCVRGDVSLCRWHSKPFCQALPYGPGYWMCCRSVHKDTPGCKVGLHDNRWVPAFHSRSVYRWSKQEE